MIKQLISFYNKKLFKLLPVILILLNTTGCISMKGSTLEKQAIVWRLDNPELIGGYKPQILGNPRVVDDKAGPSMFFDGIDDGFILPSNPVKGWKEFTVEVLFKPSADGPVAPRFIHFQDGDDNRGTIEARITHKGNWYLDTFLKNGKSGHRLTLIDSLHQHTCDQWYWIALVYDGSKMIHFINGVKELEGNLELSPMMNGQISIGVRLNKVNWFKGLIKEIRFYPSAQTAKNLHRI